MTNHTFRMPMSHKAGPLFVCISIAILYSCEISKEQYRGASYLDEKENIKQQAIPGKIQCEYYDIGGEGIAFHDADALNNGSGKLNQEGNSYFDTFRKNESVDISYTKFHDSIDNSIYNFVKQQENQLYVGWTEPGEWLKYTIDVKSSGVYQLGLMYTANDDGQISIAINGEDRTGAIAIPSTFVADDPLNWRQWHHWNYLDKMSEVEIDSGMHVFTLHTISRGQMNYDFLSFELKRSN